MVPMWNELIWSRNVPLSAMEEDDGRASISLIVEIRGEHKMGMKFSLSDFSIDIAVAGLQDLLITRLADEERPGRGIHIVVDD